MRIPKHNSIRTLAVERIARIEKTDKTFSYPDDFDPEKLLESAFEIVFDDPVAARVWISANQAKYIRERKFFQRQQITQNPDGSLVIEIETSGWADLKRWLLSLGAHARVMAPEALAKAMKKEAEEMAALYRML
mgnify:CR=1 FL=1